MKVLEQTLTLNVLDVSREELIMLKNVLYEAYVELGEWEFVRRIGLGPEEGLTLLRSINNVLKTSLG